MSKLYLGQYTLYKSNLNLLLELRLLLTSGFSINEALLLVSRLEGFVDIKTKLLIKEIISYLNSGLTLSYICFKCHALCEESKNYLSISDKCNIYKCLDSSIESIELSNKLYNSLLTVLKERFFSFISSFILVSFILHTVNSNLSYDFINSLPMLIKFCLNCYIFTNENWFYITLPLALAIIIKRKIIYVFIKKMKIFKIKMKYEQFKTITCLLESNDIYNAVCISSKNNWLNQDKTLQLVKEQLRIGNSIFNSFLKFNPDANVAYLLRQSDCVSDLQPIFEIISLYYKKLYLREIETLCSKFSCFLFFLTTALICSSVYIFYYCYITSMLSLI